MLSGTFLLSGTIFLWNLPENMISISPGEGLSRPEFMKPGQATAYRAFLFIKRSSQANLLTSCPVHRAGCVPREGQWRGIAAISAPKALARHPQISR